MNPLLSIIIYGRNPELLRTRGWVLERAGYRVFCAHNLDEVRRVALEEEVALLVLCHTLSSDDCQQALDVAATDKMTEALFINAGHPILDSARRRQIVDVFDGPRALIAAAARVLQPTTQAS